MNGIAISLYDNAQSAMEAMRELISRGYSQDDINVIGHERAFSNVGGAREFSNQGLPGSRSYTLRSIGRTRLSGPFASRYDSAQGGSYGLVNYLMDNGVPADMAGMFVEGVRRGGVLLAVMMGANQAEPADAILNRYDPVVMNDAARQWHSRGWQRYDENADPLDENELDWPSNITEPGRAATVSETETLESNWPQNIVDPEQIGPQDEPEPSWPQEIVARDEDELMDEEAETNWPHDITKRDDEA